MSTCPFYNGKNLDFTGNKFNNPYTLIQKAGRKRKGKTIKRKTRRGKKSKKTRKHRNKKDNEFHILHVY
jgi:hypothetical protein